MIDINQKDFGTLCICALRYCHGRRTYMPSHIQHIVMAHFKDLSDQDLKVIADDEQFQSDMNLWGDYCDLVDWKNFYTDSSKISFEVWGELTVSFRYRKDIERRLLLCLRNLKRMVGRTITGI